MECSHSKTVSSDTICYCGFLKNHHEKGFCPGSSFMFKQKRKGKIDSRQVGVRRDSDGNII